MKYILVAGGAGFIGANLCRRLIKDGHRVLCVDNLQTSTTEHLASLLDCIDFRFHLGDVRYPNGSVEFESLLPSFVKAVDFDQIYNLACPASPPLYQRYPIGTLLTNVLGTNNMLEIAGRADAKFLQASTSEVYGDPEVHPQDEDYLGNVSCIGPRACYDEGKRAAEALCFDFKRIHNVDVKVVRIFNTYGPLMSPCDGRVVSNFITQALRNRPLTIYGKGTQTRSFCYVDNLVDGLIKMMNSPFSGPFNLGNPNEYSISELVNLVIELTNSRSAIISKPLPIDDPKIRCPNIFRARKFLGWEPLVQLREGLEKTIKYFRGEI